MLAVEISRHGGPEVLVPVDRADPVPARGEVLVRNRWVGSTMSTSSTGRAALTR
jgi:NADPH:quinone reductase